MSTNVNTTSSSLLTRVQHLKEIPTIPAVLAPLLRYLEQPAEQIDMQKVTDLISQDKSLAAQCLQMANSPLFGRWQKVDSLRAAILGLGFSASVILPSPAACSIWPRRTNYSTRFS
jgi:HD-like signal output (HDOD) protein